MNSSLLTKLRNFFITRPIQQAWVFGSYARNEERADSDLDILVRYVDGYRPGLFGILQLTEELERLTGHRVDLVEQGTLYRRVREEVENQKISVYERNP